jgi:hypothetical protein
MRTAMNTATCAKKASGIFSCSSSALGVAGLIPVVGSITGAMGIGTDALTRGADLLAYKNEWYQLAARVVEKRLSYKSRSLSSREDAAHRPTRN